MGYSEEDLWHFIKECVANENFDLLKFYVERLKELKGEY